MAPLVRLLGHDDVKGLEPDVTLPVGFIGQNPTQLTRRLLKAGAVHTRLYLILTRGRSFD